MSFSESFRSAYRGQWVLLLLCNNLFFFRKLVLMSVVKTGYYDMFLKVVRNECYYSLTLNEIFQKLVFFRFLLITISHRIVFIISV